jgi:hypothetical protein
MTIAPVGVANLKPPSISNLQSQIYNLKWYDLLRKRPNRLVKIYRVAGSGR